MDKDKLESWIKELMEQQKLWKFYKSKYWMQLKDEVLKEQKHECQECLKHGKITIADTVHHVQYVRKHPRLALDKYYVYQGRQYKNLVAVCKECHNKLHPEKNFKKQEPLNEERW